MRKVIVNLPEGFPEFAVTREILMQFFKPPIGKTKFFELVNAGAVVQLKGIKGYFRLNESLVRLGLQPVPELPEARDIGDKEILELALTIAAPDVVDTPAWLLGGALRQDDAAKAVLLAERIEEGMAEITSFGHD